jgi:hypothetical protein
MLSGPVIKYRETLGRLTRMVILVDGSRSMELTDPDMERARKTAIASQLRNMPDSGSQEAVLDGMSRTERARAVLFEGGSESLVSELLENFEVELISMEDSRSRRIWSSKEEASAIPTALPPANNKRWKECYEVAKMLLTKTTGSDIIKLLEGATHFHAIDIKPSWAARKIKVATIEGHVFYRM